MRLQGDPSSSKGPAARFTGEMQVPPIPSGDLPHGDGPAVTWAEHVTDQEYREAARAAEKD